jgi:hypothetical protein
MHPYQVHHHLLHQYLDPGTTHETLIVVAIVCFLLSLLPVGWRLNLVTVGFIFLALAFLF